MDNAMLLSANRNMMRRQVKSVDATKPHMAPCKRQQKWKKLFDTDYEALEDKIDMLHEKLEDASRCYMRAKTKEQKKAALAIIKGSHRILRDMVLAGVIDGSSSLHPLLDRLDTLFYSKKH